MYLEDIDERKEGNNLVQRNEIETKKTQ